MKTKYVKEKLHIHIDDFYIDGEDQQFRLHLGRKFSSNGN